MKDIISAIDENVFLNALTLEDAIFEYADPELLKNYDSAYEEISSKEETRIKPENFLEGLSQFSESLLKIQSNKDNFNKILLNLKRDILNRVKNSELAAYGFKLPRNIDDKPIKIPADLFLFGDINWKKSGLISQNIEFAGIRLIKNKKPQLNVVIELPKNKKEINNSQNVNFADLDPDKHIDEKEASQYLGISPRTLQGYRIKGGGPKFHKFGKKAVRYKVSELKEWIDKNQKTNTSEY